MEIQLPARYEDLRLRHLMVLRSVSDPVERIVQITGMTHPEVLSVPVAVLDRASAHLDLLDGTETPLHPKTVSMDGKPHGFIPDWSQFTTGEWIDMERYADDVWSNAHKIMALLYRPVTDQIGQRYEIAPYTAKEDPGVWLDSPASWFAGACLFFSSSRSRLLSSTRRSLTRAVEDQIASARNGAGMTSSSIWRMANWRRWIASLRYRFRSSSSTSPTYRTFTT